MLGLPEDIVRTSSSGEALLFISPAASSPGELRSFLMILDPIRVDLETDESCVTDAALIGSIYVIIPVR